jgi:hypothetical protein
MTEAEYLDEKRFPLTTQIKGRGGRLSFDQQQLIDAINFDDLRELIECGETLTPEQQAIRLELEDKRGRRVESFDTSWIKIST